MKVVVIGSGNVAEALALGFARLSGERAEVAIADRLVGSAVECDGVDLVAVVARNTVAGDYLARRCNVPFVAIDHQLPFADLYIIAVSDDSIACLTQRLHFAPQSVVAHTAGSVPIDAIDSSICHRASFYPFQTFTRGCQVDLSEVPIFVDASDSVALECVSKAAGCLSQRVRRIDYRDRCRVHLSGVFVNNFVNALYGVGADIIGSANLDYDTLKPLIAQTARKALECNAPAEVQTGPARRGDRHVIEHHLEMLEGSEREKTIYQTISELIWETSKRI